MSPSSPSDTAAKPGRTTRRLGVSVLALLALAALSLIVPKLRALALEAYGRAGPPEARLWAVRQLGGLGEAGVLSLARLLIDEDHPQVREESQALLVKLKDQIEPALPILTKAYLRDCASDSRGDSGLYEVLYQTGGPPLATLLAPALARDPREERLGALGLLSMLGEDAKPAAGPVQAILAVGDKREVELALLILNACAEPSGDLSAAVIAVLRSSAISSYYADEILARGVAEAPTSIPLIQAATRDPSLAVRRAALKAIGQAPPDRAIPALLLGLKDPNLDVRALAAGCLRKHGAIEAAPALIDAMPSGTDAETRSYFDSLKALVGEVDLTKRARSRLASTTRRDRISGANLIRFLALDGPPSLKREVRRLLKAPSTEERRAAALAAASLKDRHPETLAALVESLRARDPEERLAAAQALAALGAPSDALEPLIHLALDRSPRLMLAAARGLASLGPRAAPALPALLSQLDRPSPDHAALRRAITIIAGGEAPLLRHGLGRLSLAYAAPVRRLNAAHLVALQAKTLAGSVPALQAALGDPDPEVRVRVFLALDQTLLTDVETLAMATALSDASESVVSRALNRLVWKYVVVPPPEVLAALLDALARWDGELRQGIFTELWNCGSDLVAILPRLRAALKDGALDHRINVAKLLRTLGKKAAPARPELEALARSGDEEERRAAALTLSGLR